ncbi:MAG: DoxX family membrane protein [Woeseiaceae bacterium]|nr:DoxX family membrane protein [Woeseiaceae bacterium]
MTTSKTHEVSVLYLLPLRLSIGISFLFSGGEKIAAGNWGLAYGTRLTEFVTENLPNAFDFYRPVLESAVLPHADKFALLTTWTELLIGVSIFLGMFTRFGAAVGIFLVLNYTFAIGVGIWMPGLQSLYFWALFTLMVCSAGRGLGIDGFLRRGKRVRLFT